MAKKTSKVKIYSALEVANICGVVNQTAINWIRNGYLKAFSTPGGQYRVYKDDLIEFLTTRGIRLPEDLLDDQGAEADWNSVIVIDDDKVLNNSIFEFLKKNLPDYNMLQAYDGFTAGTMLVEKKPGYVILDIDLPGVNGKELLNRLKNDVTFGFPYVIVVTGLDDANLEEELSALDADKFCRKPVDLKDLLTYIQETNK